MSAQPHEWRELPALEPIAVQVRELDERLWRLFDKPAREFTEDDRRYWQERTGEML